MLQQTLQFPDASVDDKLFSRRRCLLIEVIKEKCTFAVQTPGYFQHLFSFSFL